MIKLREYQIPAIEKGIKFFEKENPPSLMVLPTAAGKSFIAAYIANSINGKTIVLQPSKELLEQNYEKLMMIVDDDMKPHISIFSASMNTKEFGNITFATIGSIKSIGEEFKQLGYINLIIDEAHLFSRSVEGMLQTFLKSSEIKKVLGLTATPFKLQTNSTMMQKYSLLKMLTSRSKHGNYFKNIIHVTQIQELTSQNYWSKLIYELYDVNTGDLIFNSTGAEYTDDSINAFYKNQDIENKIIRKLSEIDRKKILVFVPSVEQAKNLSVKIKDSSVIWGDMNKDDREREINNFRNGNTRVVVNVNVLSVGFDYPEIDGIILGRPTASLAWLYQALGRGTRIHPNKENCLIIDFTNNIKTFGKIEDLIYKKDNYTWNLYGSGNRLLSGIDISQIKPIIGENDITFSFGKYYGRKISDAPSSYLEWMIKEFTFNSKNQHIKEEIKRVLDERLKTLV